MYKGVGFALLIYLIFLKYPMKMNNLVSLRPEDREGSLSEPTEHPSGSATEIVVSFSVFPELLWFLLTCGQQILTRLGE